MARTRRQSFRLHYNDAPAGQIYSFDPEAHVAQYEHCRNDPDNGYDAARGQTWPTQAGYLENIPILDNSGHAIVKVENVANSSDVHVKLVALRGLREYPAREIYIPAHGSFTMENLSPGLYDVRYRDLDNGRLARSEEFMIAEGVGVVKGASQAKTTVTLDKIQRNRVEVFALLETEF